MGRYSNPRSTVQCNSPDGQRIILKDFGDMIRVDGQTSPPPARRASSVSSTPPPTPGTPGTPLTPGGPTPPGTLFGLATTPTNPGPYRHRPPSITESDSQSSVTTQSDTASDSQSDAASVCSGTDWANFDISPLVKEELKQAIVARRKTQGLPDVQVNFDPKPANQLTPEEEERREQQKERNRSAAAKCRSKKRGAVERLMEEAHELEKTNAELRDEMQALEGEKLKLRFLLDMHSPKCLMQVASPSTSLPSPDAPKRTRMSTSTSGGKSSPGLSTTRSLTATTPTTDSSSGYASSSSSSYMSPTPSTTFSYSNTEPSTPAMLTPTSVTDAPVFPSVASSPLLSPIMDTSLGIDAQHVLSPVADIAVPATSFAELSALSVAADVDVASGTLDLSKIDIFPPVVPPTPEMEDDDPLSASFVKQYLGDDPFGAADLSLIDSTVTDGLMVDLPQNSSRLDFGAEHHQSHEKSLSIGGSSTLLSQVSGNQLNSVPAHFQFAQHPHLVPVTAHDAAAIHELVNEHPLTLSFSALLGIPFQETENAMDTNTRTSKQSAIDAFPREAYPSVQGACLQNGVAHQEIESNGHNHCSKSDPFHRQTQAGRDAVEQSNAS